MAFIKRACYIIHERLPLQWIIVIPAECEISRKIFFHRIAACNLQHLMEFRIPLHAVNILSLFLFLSLSLQFVRCKRHSSPFVVSKVQETLFFIRLSPSPFPLSTFLYSLDPTTSRKIHLCVFQRFLRVSGVWCVESRLFSLYWTIGGQMLLTS